VVGAGNDHGAQPWLVYSPATENLKCTLIILPNTFPYLYAINFLFMKQVLMVFGFFIQLFTAKAQADKYAAYPVYNGNDLGLSYSPKETVLKIWAPVATVAQVLLYKDAVAETPLRVISMQAGKNGTWLAKLPGNQAGKFYTVRVQVGNAWSDEVTDPYTKAVGVNGKRGAIIDMAATNPAGWANDKMPAFKQAVDAVIYELHVRDASIAASAGISVKGKFAGLTEKGTKNAAGLSTGLDHLVQLGVTHVHLLPCFDFNSVDESMPDKPQYNWGYDPLNYNVPEGSYSSNAADGAARIREFKQLVQTFHRNGLRVVMDVVYNHTALAEKSNFNQLVPGYYYRQAKEGGFSNATGCGNETASDRPMMRKFILESVKYWVQEYHVDGFRFDLMGVHDIPTMSSIATELRKIKPGILLYGEGWTAGASPLPDSVRGLKANAAKLEGIAVFSDDIRDGIKGSVFDGADRGFASGKAGMEESIKFGIVASCRHPQVDYTKVNYSKAPYATAPGSTVTYCECHDNNVLWDKLAISAKDASVADRKEMHQLALSIVLTSQGISFLHAGTEFLRSKNGVENSYNAPDSINAIDWNLKTSNRDVFDYVQLLVAMRRAHPAFRMSTAGSIAKNIRFMENLPEGAIGYTIIGEAVKDSWKKILVYFNSSGAGTEVMLPAGKWKLAVHNNRAGGQAAEKKLILSPYSSNVLYEE
jgi:pullulanase